MKGPVNLEQPDYVIEERSVSRAARPAMRQPQSRDEAIKFWLATLKSNGVRERTRENYQEIVRTLPADWPLDQWTLLDWWNDLVNTNRKGGPLKPSTRSVRARVVKQFLQWAETTGALDENPWVRSGIVAPKPPIGEPRKKIFTDEELDLLFNGCRLRNWWEHRLYTLMRLSLRGGLRAGEPCRLIWDDIEWDRPTPDVITIRLQETKGSGIHGKPEEIVLTGSAVTALRSWYHRQGSLGQSGPTKYVFPTASWTQHYHKRIPHFTGKPYTRYLFSVDLKEHAQRVGITRNVHPHMFRHSMGTAHYDQFGDLEATRIAMRHKKSDTTRLYMDRDKVREHVLELERKFTLGEGSA
jgi:integrase